MGGDTLSRTSSTRSAGAASAATAAPSRKEELAAAKLARAAKVPLRTVRAALFGGEGALAALDTARSHKRLHRSSDLVALRAYVASEAGEHVAPRAAREVVARATSGEIDRRRDHGATPQHSNYEHVADAIDRNKHLNPFSRASRKVQALSTPAQDRLALTSLEVRSASHKLGKILSQGASAVRRATARVAGSVSDAATSAVQQTTRAASQTVRAAATAADQTAQAATGTVRQAVKVANSAAQSSGRAARRAQKSVGYYGPLQGARARVHEQQEALYRHAQGLSLTEPVQRSDVKAWLNDITQDASLAKKGLSQTTPWAKLSPHLKELIDLQHAGKTAAD